MYQSTSKAKRGKGRQERILVLDNNPIIAEYLRTIIQHFSVQYTSVKYKRYRLCLTIILEKMIAGETNCGFLAIQQQMETRSKKYGFTTARSSAHYAFKELIELGIFQSLPSNKVAISTEANLRSIIEQLNSLTTSLSTHSKAGRKQELPSIDLFASTKNVAPKEIDNLAILISGKDSPGPLSTLISILPTEEVEKVSGVIKDKNGTQSYSLTGSGSVMLKQDFPILAAVFNIHYAASANTINEHSDWEVTGRDKRVYEKTTVEIDQVVKYLYPTAKAVQKFHRQKVIAALERIAFTQLDIKYENTVSRAFAQASESHKETHEAIESMEQGDSLKKLFRELFSPFRTFSSEVLIVERENGQREVIESSAKFNVTLDSSIQDHLTSTDTKFLYLIPKELLSINDNYAADLIQLYLAIRNTWKKHHSDMQVIQVTESIDNLVASTVPQGDRNIKGAKEEAVKAFFKMLGKVKHSKTADANIRVSIPKYKQRELYLFGYECLFDLAENIVTISYKKEDVITLTRSRRKTPTISNVMSGATTVASNGREESNLLLLSKKVMVERESEFLWGVNVQCEDGVQGFTITPTNFKNVLSYRCQQLCENANVGVGVTDCLLFKYIEEIIGFEKLTYTVGDELLDINGINSVRDTILEFLDIETPSDIHAFEADSIKSVKAFTWLSEPQNMKMFSMLSRKH